MADIEKVKKGLECCIGGNDCDIERNGDCPYKDLPICGTFLLSDAIELLKEQQPKKPVYDCPLIRCPRCKNSINVIQKYCDECGQAIDWSKDGEHE